MITLPEIFDTPVRVHFTDDTSFVVSNSNDSITFQQNENPADDAGGSCRSYDVVFSGSKYPTARIEIAKQNGRNGWTPCKNEGTSPILQGLAFFAAVALNKREITQKIKAARREAERPARVVIDKTKAMLPFLNIPELAAA